MAIDPEALLHQYRLGRFPMAEDGVHYLHDPDPRAIFPLATTLPNARMRRTIRNSGITTTADRDFVGVINGCADRDDTWLDPVMIEAYTALHRQGAARSVEAWRGDRLVGGIYGVTLEKAFFGESMFGTEPHAGKIAFYRMAELLRTEDYLLFDTQYINPHTRMLGAVEVPRATFRAMLLEALRI